MKRRFFCICMAAAALTGCNRYDSVTAFEEADRLFRERSYQKSLIKYQQIVEEDPARADRAFFEMGLLKAYSSNEERDYLQSLQYFRQVVEGTPGSPYRHDSEMMIFYLTNGALKDKVIAQQQKRIDELRQDLHQSSDEIAALKKEIAALQEKFFAAILRHGSADRIVIEKKDRRLTLLSRGEVLKTYRIALGGNPTGTKEREGDNKTPEGTYVIDSRNKNSEFHRSLHISYPNETDKKRARELGVSPGGDIMIHGIKKGFSWVGGSHAELDWTQGCIAVTDEEIEEIWKLAPDGTIVEIKP